VSEDFETAVLDVTDATAVSSFFEDLTGLDVLINAAAIVQWGSVLEIPSRQFRDVMECNVVGAFHAMQGAATRLPSGGLIVQVASVAGLRGLDHMAAYSASKFALRGLSEAASLELAPRGIRVTTLFPGQINTSMLGGGDHPEAMSPDEVAGVIVDIIRWPSSLHVTELVLNPLPPSAKA
jgi:3alpha(or 20beta)-hydroxysteroid dehydrogenase